MDTQPAKQKRKGGGPSGKLSREGERRKKARYRAKYPEKTREYHRLYMRRIRAASKHSAAPE